MAEVKYFLISQVVQDLQKEFPAITVSKVRYLDRIGILNLNRSDSGYRRFSSTDIDQLKWVLKQQQQFLPLKVIREKLVSGEWKKGQNSSGPDGAGTKQGSHSRQSSTAGKGSAKNSSGPSATATSAASAASSKSASTTSATNSASATSPANAANLAGATSTTRPPKQAKNLSLEDFLKRSGMSSTELKRLEEFNLFNRKSRRQGYNRVDLEIARLAQKMLPLGLEPRHLRIYAMAAEREADLAQQLARPILARKDVQKRQEGLEKLSEIVKLGGELQQVLLERLLSEYS